MLGDTHRQITLAKALDAALQVFQTLEQTANDGEHAHNHRHADQAQHPQKAERRPQPEGDGTITRGRAALTPLAWRHP